MSGATGVGKTALVATWVRRLLDGKGLFRIPLEQSPTEIAILITDRHREGTKYWLERAGVLKDVRLYCLQNDPTTKWSLAKKPDKHLEFFKDAVGKFGELPPGTLLIVDPISIFLGGKLHDYSHTAATIGPLNQYVAQQGWTVLGNHHVAKTSQDPKDRKLRPQDRILGSTAITGYTYTAFYLVGPEELSTNPLRPADHYEIGYVAHAHPSDKYKFKRDESGLFVSSDPRLRKPGTPAPVLRMDPVTAEAELKFLALIPNYRTVKMAALAKIAKERMDISRATAYRYIRRLVDAGSVTAELDGEYKRRVEIAGGDQ